MSKVCMAIIDRANWGRLQPLAERLCFGLENQNSGFGLNPFPTLLCGGSTVLERFKRPVDEMHFGRHWEIEELFSELDGDSPVVKARSLGLSCMDYAATLDRIKPGVLILIGDRYEALGVACAAATLRIPICHLQGGEVSGALDERYRHAISKLSDWHVPATKRAAENLIRMGERPESILAIGCPSSDMARRVKIHKTQEQPYLLVVYHPNTTHSETAAAEMEAVLKAVSATGIRAKVLWPNIDSGSGAIAKVIRQHADEFETIKNLPPLEYAELLANAACCVGNSSSFVRDSGFYGTPVVLVGDRQDGRECGANVMRTTCDHDNIRWGIEQQVKDGRYPPSDLYGDGHVCERIVKALETLPPYGQKRLAYQDEPDVVRMGSESVDWSAAE